MASSSPTTPRPSATRVRRASLVAVLSAGGLGLALGVRALFALYPSAEWQLTVVRTLAGLGVVIPILLISYLSLRSSLARAEDANRQAKAVNRVYLSTVETLATAIDSKDQVRPHNIGRVQELASGLARAVGVEEEDELKAIEAAVLLHDMGKLSVPEFILHKPGKLTPVEFERVKHHVTIATQILSQVDFPYPVVPIVRHHHEHWDGTGYPDGLAGEAIPIGARVMAVVDCHDALTSHRPYRPALSAEEALRIIEDRRGTVYDPRVVNAFVQVLKRCASGGQPVTASSGRSSWLSLRSGAQPKAPSGTAQASRPGAGGGA